jgi:hypothetical protein
MWSNCYKSFATFFTKLAQTDVAFLKMLHTISGFATCTFQNAAKVFSD